MLKRIQVSADPSCEDDEKESGITGDDGEFVAHDEDDDDDQKLDGLGRERSTSSVQGDLRILNVEENSNVEMKWFARVTCDAMLARDSGPPHARSAGSALRVGQP